MTRSILRVRSSSCASIRPAPSRTVISSPVVISSAALRFGSVSKRMSRLVSMPTSLPLLGSTTGKPVIFLRSTICRTSPSVVSGDTVTGLTTMPLS
ncbi:hypothetical protein D3C77_428530 [compost metagenome]